MIRFALRNLWSRPVRSLLALCGLTIAIMGMVGLFSVARGIQATIVRTFGRIPGLAIMQPGAPIPLFSRLPTAWGDEIARLPGVHAVTPEIWSRAHLVDGKPNFSPPRFLCGIDPVLMERLQYSVYRESMQTGRYLRAADAGTARAVISRSIASQYRKGIGDELRVDGAKLEIVGIYDCGSLLLDVTILTDIQLARRVMRINPESVCAFYVEPESGTSRDELADRIKELFRGRELLPWQPTGWSAEIATGENPVAAVVGALGKSLSRRGTPESHPSSAPAPVLENASPALASSASPSPPQLPIEVRTSEDWSREFTKFSADLDLFLLIMTSIGMTIAVLGIVNTMLMSVTERFIEIGILKANGWGDYDVLRLIAWESALLGISGGVAGCLLGWIVTLFINARWPTRIHLYASPGLLLFSLAFSVGVGLLGGLYPALWAARMRPMEAIRRG